MPASGARGSFDATQDCAAICYSGPTMMSGMKQCGRGYQQHMMQKCQMQMKKQPPPTMMIRSSIRALLLTSSETGMGFHFLPAATFLRALSITASSSRGGAALGDSLQPSISHPVTMPSLMIARTRLRQHPSLTNPISIL